MRGFTNTIVHFGRSFVAAIHTFTLKINPQAAKMFALVLIPGMVLGWHYYSTISSLQTIPVSTIEDEISADAAMAPVVSTPSAVQQTGIDLNVTTESTTASDSTTDTQTTQVQVVVNGQQVPVPESGQVYKEFQGETGDATLLITTDSSSSHTTNIQTYMNVDVTSVSETNNSE